MQVKIKTDTSNFAAFPVDRRQNSVRQQIQTGNHRKRFFFFRQPWQRTFQFSNPCDPVIHTFWVFLIWFFRANSLRRLFSMTVRNSSCRFFSSSQSSLVRSLSSSLWRSSSRFERIKSNILRSCSAKNITNFWVKLCNQEKKEGTGDHSWILQRVICAHFHFGVHSSLYIMLTGVANLLVFCGLWDKVTYV